MNVFVTGGAGAIGSALCERLLIDGHHVTVVDDLSGGRLANLADARRDADGRLSVHTLDVRVPELAVLVGRVEPEVIVHLADAPGGAPLADRVSVSAGSLASVLTVAASRGVSKVVTVESAHVYGSVASRDQPVRERQPYHPVTAAGLMSASALSWLAAYREQQQLEYTALVVPSVYGPRCEHGVVADMIRSARDRGRIVLHGDGRQVRDLIHVDDVVDALARAVSKGSGVPVNIGTGVGTAVRQLATMVAEHIGDEIVIEHGPRQLGDPERLVLDPGRARIHLGWEPFTSLAVGLSALTGEPEA